MLLSSFQFWARKGFELFQLALMHITALPYNSVQQLCVHKAEVILFSVLNAATDFLQASDIWSMGVTLYAFVYGQIPFHDDNVLALYSKIQNDTVVFREKPLVSEELKDLISRMLHKDPSQRLTLPEVKVRKGNNKDVNQFVKILHQHTELKCELLNEISLYH